MGPRKWVKQIIEIKQNGVKNPNLLGGNSAGYLQAWRKICTGDYREQNPAGGQLGRDLNSGPPNCESSALTARPGNWYNTPYSFR